MALMSHYMLQKKKKHKKTSIRKTEQMVSKKGKKNKFEMENPEHSKTSIRGLSHTNFAQRPTDILRDRLIEVM